MAKALVAPTSGELTRIGIATLPRSIEESRPDGIRRFLEFCTVTIRDKNTRIAYAQAVGQFFDWCEGRGFVSLDLIEPIVIPAYVEQHQGSVTGRPYLKRPVTQ